MIGSGSSTTPTYERSQQRKREQEKPDLSCLCAKPQWERLAIARCATNLRMVSLEDRQARQVEAI